MAASSADDFPTQLVSLLGCPVKQIRITDEERREIERMSRDPCIGERIVNSIAPSIFGHRHIKEAIALSLFGGVEKNVNGKHRVRGDINTLLAQAEVRIVFLKFREILPRVFAVWNWKSEL